MAEEKKISMDVDSVIAALQGGSVGRMPRTGAEMAELVNAIVERKIFDLAVKIVDFDSVSSPETKLTPEQKAVLKELILNSGNVDAACSALLNLRGFFSEAERSMLRKFAYTTQDEYWAYHIYRDDCQALYREPNVRAALRRVVINTKSPQRAFEFLCEQEEMREAYEDYLQSLEYTDEEVDRFKRVIIQSGDPRYCFYLLRSAEPKDPEDFIREDEGFIPLSAKEKIELKRVIIESQNPEWAYDTFIRISDLTEGEKMVLKGVFITRVKNPSTACYALCNTDFIHNLNEKERAHLRELAAQVDDKYNAEKALKYIYDLTSEERKRLEKVANQK